MALTTTGAAGAPATAAAGAGEHFEQARLRVLYAGDIDLARPQFAAGARHLTLVPVSDVLGAFGGRSVAAGVDVALIDCGAPGINAPQLMSQLRALHVPVPIVLVIDPGVENFASIALSLHSDDYTVKTPGWLGRLPVRLQIVASRYRRLKELEGSGQLEERLKAAVERAPVCLARVLDNGSVAAMNDAARSLLAVTALEDAVKKPLATFVAAAQHQTLTEFIATVCGGEARSVELPIVPKDGDERIMEIRGVALPEDGSGRRSAIIAMRDLSERRRLEASVVDVSTGDIAAERAANERLSAEVAELRQRLTDAEGGRQQLTEERDAQRQAAEAAASETARVHALLTEREQSSAHAGDLERAYHAARTELEETARAREQERQQAAELLEAEERRHLATVVARNAANARVAELSKECEAVRDTLDRQTRASAAERDAFLGRIQGLERNRPEGGVDTAALDRERQARDAAERHLSDLERRMALDADAAAAELAAARAALAKAVEERDAMRLAPEVERQGPQQTTTIDSLTARLRDAEAACQRATAERDEREKACRAVQVELQQYAELRRRHRQELLAALDDAQKFEDLATQHRHKSTELERRLHAAKAEFDELTAWATARAARVAEGLS